MYCADIVLCASCGNDSLGFVGIGTSNTLLSNMVGCGCMSLCPNKPSLKSNVGIPFMAAGREAWKLRKLVMGDTFGLSNRGLLDIVLCVVDTHLNKYSMYTYIQDCWI